MVLFSFACDIPHCGHRDINTSTEGMSCRGLNLVEIEAKRKATLVQMPKRLLNGTGKWRL